MMRTLAPARINTAPFSLSAARSSSANQISGAGKWTRISTSAAVKPNSGARAAASTSPWGGSEMSR